MSALITATELKNILSQPPGAKAPDIKNVKVLDASWNLPPSSKSIPGARDFNIDDVADPVAPFAHTVPTEEIFANKIRVLGIGNDDLVVIYDRGGIAMAAARAWWMFRLFGHDNIKILSGGLPAWTKTGYATVEKTAAATDPAFFTTKFRPELLKKVEQIASNLLRKDFTILDARDSQRFTTGHIPGSLSVPYAGLVDADGTLKPQEQLEKIFKSSSADLKKKIACSCGSGVTACVVALALHELGHKDAAVYDGSWTEWGASSILPKMTGTA
jgi:thiosulfate/3-mercaptopyruvate sulfurtransferase